MEIAWLSDEQVTMFKSDFRIVADFFTQLRKNNNYIPSNKKIKHVDAMLKMLAVFGQTEEFNDIVISGKSKEVTNMCEAIRRYKDEGISEGFELGLERGITGLIKAFKKQNKNDKDIIHEIMDAYSFTEEKASMLFEKCVKLINN